jgi:hypothetical protein
MIEDERLARAYLEVLKRVALYVRLRSRGESRLSDDELHDLMDAIHNVPAALVGEDRWFTPERMREQEFGDYDEKWSSNGGLQLVRILDSALTQ